MKSIVIIPCWRRPEFLGACLNLIRWADLSGTYHYLFAIDRRADPLNEKIIAGFPGEKTVIRNTAMFNGNSANLIKAYKWAYGQSEELVFLIEEDIFIAKDFFLYHEQVHHEFSPFFVTACRNQMDLKQTGDNPAGLFSYGKYQSLGVSFRRESLLQIIEHDTREYYSNRSGYLKKLFPQSQFGTQNTEQDGLINRIMERDNLTGIYPEIPRAFHAGFYGYNRQGSRLRENHLSLEDKIEILLSMPQAEMNKRAKRLKDIARCELETVHKVDNYFINDSTY